MAGRCTDTSCLSGLRPDLAILRNIRQEANRAENGRPRKLQGKQEMRKVKSYQYPPGWDPEQLKNMTQEEVNKALVSYIKALRGCP